MERHINRIKVVLVDKRKTNKWMCRMVDEMKRWLAEGHTITIDELGTFSLSIGVMDDNEVEDFEGNGKKVTAKRIGVRGVNYVLRSRW